MRSCKTCLSPHRAEIDTKLINGESYEAVSEWCNLVGFKISHTALKRHAENHIDGYVPKGKLTHTKVSIEEYGISQSIGKQENSDPRYTDPKALRLELNCPEVITNSEDLAHTTKRFIAEILLNQLAIVLTKQRAYMDATAHYPTKEMKGLTDVISIVGAFTNRAQLGKLGQNFLDLDKALDFQNNPDEFKNQVLSLIDSAIQRIEN